jgi:intraflagellar transport protein 74
LGRHELSQEAFQLHQSMVSLARESKGLKEQLVSLDSIDATTEKATLMEQIKEGNQAILQLESDIRSMELSNQNQKQEIQQLSQKLGHIDYEKQAKYEELIKKDSEIQEFLSKYDQKKKDAEHRNETLKKQVESLQTFLAVSVLWLME